MNKFQPHYLPSGESYLLEILPHKQFGRADHWNTDSEAEHLAAEEAYFNYQATAKKLPAPFLTPAHTSEMELNKDFELDYQIKRAHETDKYWRSITEYEYNKKTFLDKRIIAIPITQPLEKSDEGKIFIAVDVKKELPKTDGFYYVIFQGGENGNDWFKKGSWFTESDNKRYMQVEYWLKEIAVPIPPVQKEKDSEVDLWEDVGKHFTGIIGTAQWVEAINKLKSKYKIGKI